MLPHSSSVAAKCVVSVALATAGAAQCFPAWLPGHGIPGVDNGVHAATTWDPDGAGPAQPLVVLGGDFQLAGEWTVPFTAGWLPQLGQFVNTSGLGGRTSALLTLPTGELIAGGAFSSGVASFDGIAWTTLGAGLDAEVRALAVLPSGDLIAGGDFLFGNHVARWDGSNWLPVGGGTDQTVRALTVLPNGDLVAGGDFTLAGGVACNGIARWDGSNWSPLGSGLGAAGLSSVTALATLGNGDVVAGGLFTTAGGAPANNLARWNGSTWSAFGSGANHAVWTCHVLANGDLLVGGSFTQIDGLAATRVARWNGTTWSTLGQGGPNTMVRCVTTLGSDIYLGGDFEDVAGTAAQHVARWSGTAWSALGSGTDNPAFAAITANNGDLVVGGRFRLLEGTPALRIARRVGGTWTGLGGGITSSGVGDCMVSTIVELPNGDLVAGGVFTHAGGVATTNIARWNGSTWSPLGAGLPIGVTELLALPNGDVIAGGAFQTAYGGPADFLARWDGSVWAPLGGNFTAPWFGGVYELERLANGDVIAAGVFSAAAGVPTTNLARWDGTQWHAFGQPLSANSYVNELIRAANGDLLVSGNMTMIGGVAANFVARWDGSTWAPIGNLQMTPGAGVSTLLELPGGDIFAGGRVRVFGLDATLLRWDGTQWLPTWSPASYMFGVGMLALTQEGDLAAGGYFTAPGGATNFAYLRTPCAATATTFGAGCTGSGGANTLRATTLPWTGTTFQARATGLAPSSLAIGVRGLGTGSTPLQPLLPQALPGCNLLVSPDLLDLYLPSAAVPGTADLTFAIPDAAALIGGVLHLQVVPVVLAGSGAILEFSASNALTLTIGSW